MKRKVRKVTKEQAATELGRVFARMERRCRVDFKKWLAEIRADGKLQRRVSKHSQSLICEAFTAAWSKGWCAGLSDGRSPPDLLQIDDEPGEDSQ